MTHQELLNNTVNFVNTVRSGVTRAYRLLNYKETFLLVGGKTVASNMVVDWPDMNFPGDKGSLPRKIHAIDYDEMRVQLDNADGPWFDKCAFPPGVMFCHPIKK